MQQKVLPKCKSTESITQNSAKFRNGFSDFRYFIRSRLTLATLSRELGETSDRSVNGCFYINQLEKVP